MSNLSLKKKDDIFIKLTECLDKSSSVPNLSNEARAVNHGWVTALKWVLGYDELHKQSDDELSKPLPDGFREIDLTIESKKEDYDESDFDIDMNKL